MWDYATEAEQRRCNYEGRPGLAIVERTSRKPVAFTAGFTLEDGHVAQEIIYYHNLRLQQKGKSSHGNKKAN